MEMSLVILVDDHLLIETTDIEICLILFLNLQWKLKVFQENLLMMIILLITWVNLYTVQLIVFSTVILIVIMMIIYVFETKIEYV